MEQGGQDQAGCDAKAQGIDQHDRLKAPVEREHRKDPDKPGAADAEGGQHGDAKAPQVPGHHLIAHAEGIGGKDRGQPDVAKPDHLRVRVEQGQELPAKEEHQRHARDLGDGILDEADPQDLPAAGQVAGTAVLAGEGGAGLAEGIQHVVAEDLDVECGSGGRDGGDPQGVDCRLDQDVCDGKHRALDAGGKADPEDSRERLAVDPKEPYGNPDRELGAKQHGQEKEGAHALEMTVASATPLTDM